MEIREKRHMGRHKGRHSKRQGYETGIARKKGLT
jgi:hypothetical protein